MKDKFKDNSGITLIVLVVTIIVMAIIATISIYEGRKIIKTSKVQTKETDMLAIEAKAKAYAEEIESKIWVYKDNEKDVKRNAEFLAKGMTEANISSEAPDALSQVDSKIDTSSSSNYVAYVVTKDALSNMGLDEINSEDYIVIFGKTDYKYMDIIYTQGLTYNDETYYTLSSLEEVLEE